MSNPIKYSTGSESLALKKGNFYIGTGDVGKGPTSNTGYYNGITPPSGGYTIYLNKETGGPSIYTASNDAQLISLTNSIAGQSYTTVNECLVYFAGQTDKMVLNRNYEGIVTDGLILNLDAGFTPSYPKSGTTWYDVSVNTNNGTLTNGPTFSTDNGGSIVFDGTNDEIVLTNPITFTNTGTVSAWVKYNNTSVDLTLAAGNDYDEGYWFYTEGSNVYSNWGNNFVRFGTLKSSFPQDDIFYITLTLQSGTARLYKNSELLSSSSTSAINGTLRSFGRLYKNGFGNYANMNGNMYSTQIYNRALTSSEVLQNYNAQKGRFGL